MRLPLPARGESSRLRVGRLELILEPRRGAHALLCLDGADARTWWLGLPRGSELEVQNRVPRWPLRLSPRETLVLAPGGRVRGYVAIPLVPTVVLRRPGIDGAAVICELLPSQLGAEWDEAAGVCIQRVGVAMTQRLVPPAAEPQAVVPLCVRNDGPHVQSPGWLPLALHDRELRLVRGSVLARPRRLRLDGSGVWTTSVRAVPVGAS